MFATYLRRELRGRRKQTLIVAIGLALAIALVIVVTAISSGIASAQRSALSSLYGIGTDITVTQTPTAPTEGEGPGRFEFGTDDGSTGDDGSTELSQTRLTAGRGEPTFAAATVETVLAVDGVADAAASLALESMTFSGEIPAAGGAMTPPSDSSGDSGTDPAAGRGSFDVASFGVTGVPVDSELGPLSATTLVDGRSFAAGDEEADVVVLDEAYATTEGLAVGDSLAIAGTDFEVIGIVASASESASTASDTYIPLTVAQTLSGLTDQVNQIAVQATSSDQIDAVRTAIEQELPDATVNTQADLASSVSGSLGTAAGLVSSLGTWLAVIVLGAAFVLAILFTISGVTRRTREFGTLKALGWSNGRVVRQVAGESLVQGAIGGVLGLAVGLVTVLVINLVSPTISTAAAETTGGPMGGPGGGFGTAATTSDITLTAEMTAPIILIAIGLAILGGLLAGAIGGWRAARLRPAEAFRSLA